MIGTENQAAETSRSMSAELRGNPLQEPAETENTNKNEDDEELQSDPLRDLLDWLQEFREKFVDESRPLEPRGNPTPKDQDTASSSHDFAMESRARMEPGSG